MLLKRRSWIILITGVLLIWTIKFIIRPFIYIDPALKPLVGLAPNLIGSFLLPFGACTFFRRIFRLETEIDLHITCGFGLLLVIINEFLQLIPIFGRTFDYLDILSSVIGVFLGHLYFRKLMFKYTMVSIA